MKKPLVIILIIAVFFLILLAVACFLIYTYVLPIFVSDTVTGGPEVGISVEEEDSDDVVYEEDEVRVCDKITAISDEGAFSSSASITDDSDSNACFFNIGGVDYGIVDLESEYPEDEINSLKTMYYEDELEEIDLPGATAAYWSTMGGILMVWDGDRIITINSSSNVKEDVVSVVTAYLN